MFKTNGEINIGLGERERRESDTKETDEMISVEFVLCVHRFHEEGKLNLLLVKNCRETLQLYGQLKEPIPNYFKARLNSVLIRRKNQIPPCKVEWLLELQPHCEVTPQPFFLDASFS